MIKIDDTSLSSLISTELRGLVVDKQVLFTNKNLNRTISYDK